MSRFKLGTLSLTMGREHGGTFKLSGSSCVSLSVRRVIVWVAGCHTGGRRQAPGPSKPGALFPLLQQPQRLCCAAFAHYDWH